MAGVLPPDVVVNRAEPAPAAFDARFGALYRRYVYRLADSTALVDPLRRHHVLRHTFPLDVPAMAQAAALLLGQNDFAAYCRPRPGATTIRTLQDLRVERVLAGVDAGILELTFQADAFCHSMVRSLVGGLLAVGEGRQSAHWPAQLLAGSERRAVVAPAHGLTLEEVAYPPDEDLAARAVLTRARRKAEGGYDPEDAEGDADPAGEVIRPR
jgi:tRNA pseudouridine38-40 synthase